MIDGNVDLEEISKYFVFNEDEKGKVKMHTRRLDLNDWVKIDATYRAQMELRNRLMTSKRQQVFVSRNDESTNECKWELFDLLVEYLPHRFPDVFKQEENSIYNKVLKTHVSTKHTDDGVDPLIKINKLTQEDWIIAEWSVEEQEYLLTAGTLCFANRWNLTDKFNKVISDIHAPVKPYTKHLESKVSKLLKSMKPRASFWRANWGIVNDIKNVFDLYAPPSETTKHSVFDREKSGRELIFRTEYQTLRKLPKTQCIVFSIRTFQIYLEQFKTLHVKDSKGLINAIESLDEEFYEYKGGNNWGDATLQYLKMIVQQRERHGGIMASTGVLVSVYLAIGCALTWNYFSNI